MLKHIGQKAQIELLKCTNHWHVYATTATKKENPLKIQNIDVFKCHDVEIDARWYTITELHKLQNLFPKKQFKFQIISKRKHWLVDNSLLKLLVNTRSRR